MQSLLFISRLITFTKFGKNVGFLYISDINLVEWTLFLYTPGVNRCARHYAYEPHSPPAPTHTTVFRVNIIEQEEKFWITSILSFTDFPINSGSDYAHYYKICQFENLVRNQSSFWMKALNELYWAVENFVLSSSPWRELEFFPSTLFVCVSIMKWYILFVSIMKWLICSISHR